MATRWLSVRWIKLGSKYSDFISEKIGRDYHYLSQLFSQLENVTIERFIILQKIEKVKETLSKDVSTLDFARGSLKNCYLATPYADLLKLRQSTPASDKIILAQDNFTDPQNDKTIFILFKGS